MNILVLDTSAAHCAAALVCEGAVRAARSEAMTRGHGERLFALIDAVCAAFPTGAQIDLVAACAGPGSFTGTRIAVAAARGLSLGLGVRAVGVDLFEAIAAGRPGPLVVALSAPGGVWGVRRFRDGAALGPAALTAELPSPAPGETFLDETALGEDRIPALAAAAAAAAALERAAPAPLYLRPADAALPASGPAPLLT